MKQTKPRGGKIDFTIPEMFPLIESGAKYVTIRKHRKNDLEVGGILKVYLGNRLHGGQRYLGTAEILALDEIHFVDRVDYIEIETSFLRKADLYLLDGFRSFDEFRFYHTLDQTVGTTRTKQIITFGNQSWLN